MQSWPSHRWAEAGFGPRQSLSLALIRVPFLSCCVQATCLFWVPFPHVLEHGVHSVIIHLQRNTGNIVVRNQEGKNTITSYSLAHQCIHPRHTYIFSASFYSHFANRVFINQTYITFHMVLMYLQIPSLVTTPMFSKYFPLIIIPIRIYPKYTYILKKTDQPACYSLCLSMSSVCQARKVQHSLKILCFKNHPSVKDSLPWKKHKSPQFFTFFTVRPNRVHGLNHNSKEA